MADSGINSVVTDIGYDAQVRNSAYQEQLNKQKGNVRHSGSPARVAVAAVAGS